MDLTVSQESGFVLAKTTGPIDDSAQELFRQRLHDYLGKSGTVVVLDLSGSSYINSQGVAHLVTLVAYVNSKSNRAIVCGLTPHVAGVIAVTKLNKFFEIVPALSDAIERAKA